MSASPLVTEADIERQEVAQAPSLKTVYVYEAPVRLWHWINACAILVLCISGYFIGKPLPTVSGEASSHFVLGYIRFAHFMAGYVVTIGFAVRMYWAIVGNHHARELVTVPIFSKQYWCEFVSMLKRYAFMRKQPNQYVGHNPLARLMMFMLFLLGIMFMMASGWALYGEGAQEGSWAHTLLTSWMLPLFGNSLQLHQWHRMGMWMMVVFIMLHIYAAIREDIMGRTSIVSTMISGFRTFKS